MAVNAYPLQWPHGWPRVKQHRSAPYRVGYKVAAEGLLKEVRLLGGEHLVISSNAPVRKSDGLPYTEAATERSDDPGVAVYFTLEGEPTVIACDQWDTVKDNIRAVSLTVSAMRAIQRSGATELLRRAFQGFKALSGPAPREWWEVLGVEPSATVAKIDARFRHLARTTHPDRGGDEDEMKELNAARDAGRQARIASPGGS